MLGEDHQGDVARTTKTDGVFRGAELDDARDTVVAEVEAAIESVRKDRDSSNDRLPEY